MPTAACAGSRLGTNSTGRAGEGPTLRHTADLAAHAGRAARGGVGGGRRPDAAAPAPSTPRAGGGAGGPSPDTPVPPTVPDTPPAPFPGSAAPRRGGPPRFSRSAASTRAPPA